MPNAVRRILSKQLLKLESDRERIDRQITAIRGALEALSGNGRRGQGMRSRASRRTRRRMSAEARRAIARRMKAHWAKRKAVVAAKKEEPDGRKAKR
jgi:hypothetical protein